MDSKKKRKSRMNDDAKPRRSLRIQLAKNKNLLPELPLDIIVNIISRLHVKLITRCKALSKDIKNIISGNSFSNTYLTNNSNYLSTFIVNSLNNVSSLHLVELDKMDVFDEKGTHEIRNVSIFKLDRLTGGACERCTISGHCNGLFCALKFQSGLYNLYVINPILGESIQLPKPVVPRFQKVISFAYGIGYCQLTNRYKVLTNITYDIGGEKFKNECGIFIIGSDQNWRRVSNADDQNRNLITTEMIPPPMVPFRSALHWIVTRYTTNGPYWGCKKNMLGRTQYICAFDMTEEKVNAVPLPPEVVINPLSLDSLSVLLDKLCVWQIYRYTSVEVWVMDKYGVEASWTKKFKYILSNSEIMRALLGHRIPRFTLAPLAVSPEGVIVAGVCNKLALLRVGPQFKEECSSFRIDNKEWLGIGRDFKQHPDSYLSPFVPGFVSLGNLVQG